MYGTYKAKESCLKRNIWKSLEEISRLRECPLAHALGFTDRYGKW